MTFRCERAPTGVPAEIAARFAALVPVIQTPRLTLRAPRVDDFPAYAAIACTERGRHIGGPMSREDAWYDWIQFASSWLLHGHGGWTITDRADGRVLGFGILGLEPDDREIELGYVLVEDAEGKGYVTEAMTAVRDFARDTLRLDTVVSYIAHGNDRSAAVARRLGAERDTDAEAALDAGVFVYRHRLGRQPGAAP